MPDRLEGTPPKLYLVVDGTPWRIHDADYRDFKVIPRRLSDPAAQSRYFVAQDGTRRVYQFKKQDDGRPDIQKFAGALQGQRAKKGIFITTSSFSREAEEYAQRIDSRIVLIDGIRLAGLMFDFDVGVTARSAYTVKQLDGDYFEDT